MRDGRLRIALISPRGPLYRHRTGIWAKSLRYAPLTLTTLASLVPPELGAEVVLMDEGIVDIDPDCDVDLVGITVITGTAPRAYELAAHFRARGIPVVLGGAHPTLMPDEAAPHADAVVVGYAEETWPQLLRDFVSGRMSARYDQSPQLRLANLPLPRRDLLPASQYVTLHTIEATRGCIHNCEFCVVPSAWGRPLQKPVGDVVADIRQMRPRKLIFVDLNLIADADYAKELFRALAPLNVQWYGLATTMIAWDDELLELAARSGCRGLLIGLESLSAGALCRVPQAVQRARGVPDGHREAARRTASRSRAASSSASMMTTPACSERTAQFAIDAHIDLPRFAIVTPFPGTPLHTRLAAKGRMLTTDWEPVRRAARRLSAGAHDRRGAAARHGAGVEADVLVRGIASPPRGSRVQPGLLVAANLGYRFYAHHLQPVLQVRLVLAGTGGTRHERHASHAHSSCVGIAQASATSARGRWSRSAGDARRADAARRRGPVLRRPDGADPVRRADRSRGDQRRDLHRASARTRSRSEYRRRGVPVVMGGFHADARARMRCAVCRGDRHRRGGGRLAAGDRRLRATGSCGRVYRSAAPAVARRRLRPDRSHLSRQALPAGRPGRGRPRLPFQMRVLRGADVLRQHADAAAGGRTSSRRSGAIEGAKLLSSSSTTTSRRTSIRRRNSSAR